MPSPKLASGLMLSCLLGLSLNSCQTGEQSLTQAQEQALESALLEVKSRQRTPATTWLSQLNPDSSQLSGAGRILYFAKISNQSAKSTSEYPSEFLQHPILLTMKSESVDCLKSGSRERCINIGLRSTRKASEPRHGDVLEVIGQIDLGYRSRALIANGRTMTMQNEAGLSAGLWAMPLELPGVSAVPSLVNLSSPDHPLHILTEVASYLKSHNNRLLKSDGSCQNNQRLFLFKDKDQYGRHRAIFWCEGQPWPALINTSEYLAVTLAVGMKK